MALIREWSKHGNTKGLLLPFEGLQQSLNWANLIDEKKDSPVFRQKTA
jgi:hypothetical protein